MNIIVKNKDLPSKYGVTWLIGEMFQKPDLIQKGINFLRTNFYEFNQAMLQRAIVRLDIPKKE